MKKLLPLILALTLLTSCGSVNPDGDMVYYISPAEAFVSYDNGAFYQIDGVTRFIDFDTMVSSPICPKPNCSHTDPDTCSALGMHYLMFVYNGALWWFTTRDEYKDGEYRWSSDLITSDLAGTNRRKVAELKGLEIYYRSRYIRDGKLYFTAWHRGMDKEKGISNNYDKMYLYSYDFSTNTFEELWSVDEGYGAYMNIEGCFEDRLILDYAHGSDDPNVYNPSEYGSYGFDGSFEVIERKVCSVQKDYMIFVEDDDSLYVKPAYEDKEYHITDERITKAFWKGFKVFNGYLWVEGDGYAYNLKTGKVRETTQDAVIRAYYNGRYIMWLVGNGFEYVSRTEKEIFVD